MTGTAIQTDLEWEEGEMLSAHLNEKFQVHDVS